MTARETKILKAINLFCKVMRKLAIFCVGCFTAISVEFGIDGNLIIGFIACGFVLIMSLICTHIVREITAREI